MEDLERYNELNKHISALETFFDVFHVVTNHNLLGELKSSSISYLIIEMGERLESIKKLSKETHEKLQDFKKTTGVIS
ncbi:MAG: hypothetical protein HXY47_01245 [Nitrospirae bacterium]|nr:hypothetical protein [Nitrospirota bacterium]